VTHRKTTSILAASLAALSVGGVALASSHARTMTEGAQEAHILGLPIGYAHINMATCKFTVKEVDLRPGPGEPYARAEDLRHDALDNCLRRRVNQSKAKPDTDGVTGYTQVSASGTGKSVTATCPAGDVVLGGGSPDEVTGSYPSSATTWTVNRDHLSPPKMTVIATCAVQAAS
jgi:hypothetical protein